MGSVVDRYMRRSRYGLEPSSHDETKAGTVLIGALPTQRIAPGFGLGRVEADPYDNIHRRSDRRRKPVCRLDPAARSAHGSAGEVDHLTSEL